MAQQMIHSDFMHSMLSSGVATVTQNDLIDGILLYVAFDDAVSQSTGHLCRSCLFTFFPRKKYSQEIRVGVLSLGFG